jgi:hypothetical protein
MLEVKHAGKNCTRSRNVIFLLNTGLPFTVISPALAKLVLTDCKIPVLLQKLGVKINGRDIYPRFSKDHYGNANILGMDYMKENNV